MFLLDDAMCDLAAAINPAIIGVSGWDCSGGIPSPSVICGWGTVTCNNDLSVTDINLNNEFLMGTLPASIGDINS